LNQPEQNHQDSPEQDDAKVKGVKVYRGEELIMRLKEIRSVAHYSCNNPSGLAKKISDKITEFQNKQNDSEEDEDEDEDPNKKIKIIAIIILFAAVIYLIL